MSGKNRYLIQLAAITSSAVLALVPLSAFAESKATGYSPQSLIQAGATSVQLQKRVNGVVTSNDAGVQALDGGPIQDQSYFRAGSTTKTFIATVLLQLVDEGKIKLDDPVETYLPGKLAQGSQITVRQLLTQRSGLSNAYLQNIALNNPASYPTTSAKLKEMFAAHYNTDQLLSYISNEPLSFAPGSAFQYANANYVVAGAVIQSVTGSTYQEAVRDRIIQPLQLTHTLMPGSDQNIPYPAAQAYEDGGALVTDNAGPIDVSRLNPSQIHAAGELISTTGDLNIFIKSLVTGKLLSKESFALMSQPHDTGQGYNYGMGLIVLDTPCGTVYGHNGAVYGYATEMYSTADGSRQVAVGAAEGVNENYIDLSSKTGPMAIQTLCSN